MWNQSTVSTLDFELPLEGRRQTNTQAMQDILKASGALLYGDFVLKSGEKSPYFVNFGEIYQIDQLADMAEVFAQGIHEIQRQYEQEKSSDEPALFFDNLFGPAYKGIVLGAAIATALARLDKKWHAIVVSFDRKEQKSHGEKGLWLGKAPNQQRVLIIDDVFSQGTAKNQALALLKEADAQVAGLIVGLDRSKNSTGEHLADLWAKSNQIPVFALLNTDQLDLEVS